MSPVDGLIRALAFEASAIAVRIAASPHAQDPKSVHAGIEAALPGAVARLRRDAQALVPGIVAMSRFRGTLAAAGWGSAGGSQPVGERMRHRGIR